MNKQELEQALVDPESLKALTDRARQIKEKYGTLAIGIDQPSIRVQRIEPDADEIRPTREEIERTKQDHLETRTLLPEMLHRIPELKDIPLRDALTALTERYRADSSPTNALLVEDAINRLLSTGEPSEEAMKQVDAAIHLVSEGEGASDLIWMWLYQHASYGGWSYLLMQPQGSRYRNVRYIGDGYNDQASSLKVLESQGERGLAILFENVPYEGRYATFPGESGGTAATGNVGPFINDLTSSLMLVRRAPPEREIPFTLGGILRPEIQQFATSISQQVSLRGQPIVTWDMWPDFSPSSKYVYLRVPVTVHVPGWFDYSAEIRYWIYPWVDGQGQLKAYVAAYGCWVEGGILSGTVADQIMQALPGTVGTVNTKIDDLMRAMVIFGPYTECYLLPGTSGYPGTAPVTGNTTDDVTVVLVRK